MVSMGFLPFNLTSPTGLTGSTFLLEQGLQELQHFPGFSSGMRSIGGESGKVV